MCVRQALMALGHAKQHLLYSVAFELSTSLGGILLKAINTCLLVKGHNIFQPPELVGT